MVESESLIFPHGRLRRRRSVAKTSLYFPLIPFGFTDKPSHFHSVDTGR
jgi:hypothetical protein